MKQISILEQADNNQFTLYDSGSNSIIRKFEGFEFADVRYSIDDVSGDYGATYITSKFGRRRASIEGDLIGDSIFTNRRLLVRALRQTGTMKLIKFTTYDDLELQFEAEVVKLMNPYTHRIHTFLIELIAPDWRFYSQTLSSVNIGQTSVLGGASIPAAIPMSIASPSAADSETTNVVNNAGTEQTDPILTVHGPGTTFTLENNTTGESLVLSTTLIEGDTVEIDVKNRTVIKNGITNLYGSISGDFWSLVPGDNEIRFYINSGNEPDVTKLNIQYRDAYNGI